MTQNNTTTRPLIGLDGTVHRRRSVFLSNFRRCPALSPTISINFRVFVLNFDCYVEIDDLQIEIVITDKIVRLDVSMRNFVLVRECESFDEAPAVGHDQ